MISTSKDTRREDLRLIAIFSVVVLLAPILFIPFGAAYPDLLQRFAVFGIFAIGFNILFGLTGYLSFGHAAFLGVGSYSAVWAFKLLGMNPIPALLMGTAVAGAFSVLIGYISLKRSGIYFSILTLAFAQMSYNLAYSVLTPITRGETGLRVLQSDPRIFDYAGREGPLVANLFGIPMTGWNSFYFCAVLLILAFALSVQIARSPFGMMLQAIKANQTRLRYTGFNTKPYLLAAFVISGMYAGLAGSMMAVTDPLAGAERMQWTRSGEVVLMTILGGVGTLLGPMIGAVVIKYAENIFSAFNKTGLTEIYSVLLPDGVAQALASFSLLFVGDGWHLTLGILFMAIVIFLPGGLVEGFRRLVRLAKNRRGGVEDPQGAKTKPAE